MIRHGVWSLVAQLVEKTNTPLVCTYMAKGILAFHHPLNRFALGTDDDSPGLAAINESDLVIAIGVDRVEIEPSFWHRDGGVRRVVHIHAIPSESDNNYPVILDLVGDLGATLAANELTGARDRDAARTRVYDSRLRGLAAEPHQGTPKRRPPRRDGRPVHQNPVA